MMLQKLKAGNQLEKEILELKEKRNAIILAHNYQNSFVQNIADYVGSSFELAKKAQKIDCDIIVFCGVDFMANTTKILNPDKVVVMPDYRAGCPLARMLKPQHIIEAKEKYPKAPVLLYTNSDIECQALADAIYTAGNVLNVVEKMANEFNSNEVIFGPDLNMAYYVGKRLKKEIIPIPKNSYCKSHIMIMPEFVEALKEEHPKAKFMAHMECFPAIQEMADYVGSTGDMVRWIKEDSCDEWIVGTVESLIYRLSKEDPSKKFYPVRAGGREISRCPNMDLTSLHKIKDSLAHFDEISDYNPCKPSNKDYSNYDKLNPRKIEIPEEIARKARKAIENMLRF